MYEAIVSLKDMEDFLKSEGIKVFKLERTPNYLVTTLKIYFIFPSIKKTVNLINNIRNEFNQKLPLGYMIQVQTCSMLDFIKDHIDNFIYRR
jgi:hypothetical protein